MGIYVAKIQINVKIEKTAEVKNEKAAEVIEPQFAIKEKIQHLIKYQREKIIHSEIEKVKNQEKIQSLEKQITFLKSPKNLDNNQVRKHQSSQQHAKISQLQSLLAQQSEKIKLQEQESLDMPIYQPKPSVQQSPEKGKLALKIVSAAVQINISLKDNILSKRHQIQRQIKKPKQQIKQLQFQEEDRQKYDNLEGSKVNSGLLERINHLQRQFQYKMAAQIEKKHLYDKINYEKQRLIKFLSQNFENLKNEKRQVIKCQQSQNSQVKDYSKSSRQFSVFYNQQRQNYKEEKSIVYVIDD